MPSLPWLCPMQSRFAFPVVLLSVVAAIAFTAEWWRDRHQVHHLTISTGGQDGEYYAFAQALSEVIELHYPTIQVTVLESAGSPQNIERLAQGKVNLAIVQSDTPVEPTIRAIAYLFPEVFHLLAAPNSGIQQVSDLRGKRVALMPRGSGSYTLFWTLAEHYGLTEADLTPLPMAPQDAYAALNRGEADALFRIIALGSSSIREFLKTSRASLVPIDQAASLRLALPYLEAGDIPKGTYNGAGPVPATDLPVVGVRAILVTHDGMDSELIRIITQTLFEFRTEILARYPRAAMIRLPDSGENLGMPLHPGAKAFYEQDEPNFLVAYAEPIGLLFSVSVLAVSGFWQFRMWLLERQKNRADMYNLKILELIEQVQDAHDLAQLNTIRRELFDIFNRVVVDLDKDRISPQSFQSFTFPWEVAINSIRHREMVLMNLGDRLPSVESDPVKQPS